jgi:hypothetical protein
VPRRDASMHVMTGRYRNFLHMLHVLAEMLGRYCIERAGAPQ